MHCDGGCAAPVCSLYTHFYLYTNRFYYQYTPDRLPICPVTIHALLHIADSITKAGPVWALWAFIMERYCGALQPAIRSRRFPYASLNRYVLNHARLTQIKLIYGSRARSHLALRADVPQKGRRVPGCEYVGWHGVKHLPTKCYSDDTCVLLPAHHRVILERGLKDKVVAASCTRFNTVTPSVLRRAMPGKVDGWGKVRILNDGDTIRAAALEKSGRIHGMLASCE